nr:dihydrolipoyllysine-residue succinyltransferase component of 2-oxoglutarate dehydrogenase complex [uncultured bacterium]
MAVKVLMPQLGESVTEGTIVRWIKKVGERVEKYEPLLEVMTDKVNAEVPAPATGVLREILVPEGETVPVGRELAVIAEAGAEAETGPPSPAAPAAQPRPEPAAVGADVVQQRSSPIVRRLAQEYGIDLSEIKGSGIGGRVTKEDVLRYVAERQQAAAAVKETPPAEAPPPAGPDEEVIPVSPMRRQIAQHMVHSYQTVPHAWLAMEADVTRLVRLRESAKDEFRRREGVDLTYLPFVVKAAVEALKEHPMLNAVWAEDKIILKKRINIGIAVALEDGLVVPVIKDADQKSIAGLARAIADLTDRARAGRLTLEDVQGGTFTVNNTGALGSVISRPIINEPQVGILTSEAIVKRPVVVDDAIAIRSVMFLCLSFDHRVIDGLAAARFLQAVKRRLEAYDERTSIY